MCVPPSGPGASPLAGDVAPWAALDQASKRARVLEVAGRLFARDGLDVPMPALAEALGVGVGSIYRQVGRKDDIVAALVVERMERVSALMEAAAREPDAWVALRRVVAELVDETTADRVTQRAWAASGEHPDVLAARPRARDALEALVRRAREQEALRTDATTDDLRLALQAVKQAEDLGPGGARRLAALVLRGMAAPGRDD